MKAFSGLRATVGIILFSVWMTQSALAEEINSPARTPASLKRIKSFAAPHLQRPVPDLPDWVVGVEVATKSKVGEASSGSRILKQPEFIQASDATAPLNQRDHQYFRDHLWVVRERR